MNHRDCKFYLAVDVFNGLCKRTKETVLADDQGCEKGEPCPRCKHCRHFTETDSFLGTCQGVTITYPDLNAGTCEQFSWN
jgi:4-hydroxyphenylacetate decarboxylase small subunit